MYRSTNVLSVRLVGIVFERFLSDTPLRFLPRPLRSAVQTFGLLSKGISAPRRLGSELDESFRVALEAAIRSETVHRCPVWRFPPERGAARRKHGRSSRFGDLGRPGSLRGRCSCVSRGGGQVATRWSHVELLRHDSYAKGGACVAGRLCMCVCRGVGVAVIGCMPPMLLIGWHRLCWQRRIESPRHISDR